MKRFKNVFTVVAVAITVASSALLVSAQDQAPGGGGGGGGAGGGRRNFDPEQMRARMMERYREQMEVKDDAEWKLIEERIDKVSQARREVGFGGGMGFFGGGGRGGRGPGGDNVQPAGNDRRGPRGFGNEPSPEAEALQAAVEAKASSEDLKAKMEKLRESRKVKEAKLEKAQDELRKVLTVRQEATAVLAGLLK